MIVLIVRRLDEERNEASLHFLDYVDDGVAEGASGVYWALAEELDLVTSLIWIKVHEVSEYWISFVKLGANLSKDRVFAVMINVSCLLKFESLPTINSYFEITPFL